MPQKGQPQCPSLWVVQPLLRMTKYGGARRGSGGQTRELSSRIRLGTSFMIWEPLAMITLLPIRIPK